MNFHKNFFKNVKNYLNKDGVIILVENCEGVTENDIIELTNDDFTIEYVEYNDYGWTGKSLFYTIILKLK
jgi:cyclopropane fatty-acyl-phospholipid synthase-like methyltransferase